MRLGAMILAALSALAAGCKSDPYCLNCVAIDGGPTFRDLAGTSPDLFSEPDLLPPPPDLIGVGPDGGCVPSNGGVERCDGLDNDCNGTKDDVAPANLAMDPNNCGMCGNVCNYPAERRFGVCGMVSGVPTCQPGMCLPGYFDADANPADCEYACVQTQGGNEICDGIDNDCDRQVDEGFDLQNSISHCGVCNNACTRPNATAKCVTGTCDLDVCNTGYKDLDNNRFNGCEYRCPVFPAVSEVCNSVDDDCDGVIDDMPTDVGGACDTACPGPAACVAAGTCSFPLSSCVGRCCGVCTAGVEICTGGMKSCQPGMGARLEVCNSVDDDCDGQVDQGFNLQTDVLNCGSCGNRCNLPNAIARCSAGACRIDQCRPGFGNNDSNDLNGCEYTCPVNPKVTESCNGKDDDCNGVVDNGLVTPSNFCVQTSICSGSQPLCQGAQGWRCNYSSNVEVDANGNIEPAELKCDGLDGNCNTQIDESFVNKGQPCGTGQGLCRGTSTFVCNMAQNGTSCPATPNPMAAKDEECNDVDDNCDGVIDEATPVAGSQCFNGSQHACLGWHDQVTLVNGVYVYRYEATRPDATPTAQGASRIRACSRAGTLPWSNVTYAEADAACKTVKNPANMAQTMRLCSEAEWQDACDGPSNTNLYSYSVNPTVYQTGVCNDANRTDPDAVWTTGGRTCFTSYAGGGEIHDLSGNVMEWTSTCVDLGSAGMPRWYCGLRGGAFNSPADGTQPDGISCQYDFNLWPQAGPGTSRIGFRCCGTFVP